LIAVKKLWNESKRSTMANTYQLKDNEVAILWYDTREIEIITIEGLDEVEDMDIVLDELGYNVSQISYMA